MACQVIHFMIRQTPVHQNQGYMLWACAIHTGSHIRPGTGSTNPDAGDIGEIYVGDVGMGTWEELNVIKEPGTNCGWPFYEGLAKMPQFQNPVANKDEPNPLFGTGGCTQQYFTFQNLFKQVTADNLKTVYNPCNPSMPIGTGNRFVHRRPLT